MRRLQSRRAYTQLLKTRANKQKPESKKRPKNAKHHEIGFQPGPNLAERDGPQEPPSFPVFFATPLGPFADRELVGTRFCSSKIG